MSTLQTIHLSTGKEVQVPKEFILWISHEPDSGLCVNSVLAEHEQQAFAGSVQDWVIPVPILSVMRGFRMREGFVVATSKDLHYDQAFGLICPDEDEDPSITHKVKDTNLDFYEVGNLCPGYEKLPPEGCLLELGSGGVLMLYLVYPDITASEKRMLTDGFESWAITKVKMYNKLLAVVTFKHYYEGKPTYLETFLHAGLYKDDRAEKFITGSGNVLTSLIIDKGIIVNIRTSGIALEGIEELQRIIKIQKQEAMTKEVYSKLVDQAQIFSSEDLFKKGMVFKHK